MDELRRDQHSADAKGRAGELLDRANALGDEQPLALARFSPPEISR